ncbi:MAG: hypothetical protein L0Y71_23175 [Gemmataceae bacterium]|nr:hypothetical protein [Gemmataceae bacterium]
MYSRVICFVAVSLGVAGLGAPAATAGDAEVKVIADGLVHPTGIAIHPQSGALYVCESGAGKVIRIDPATGKTSAVITGFKLDIYGKGPKYEVGPLGLLFLDGQTLVVGGGDLPDGQELMRVYKLQKGKTFDAEDAFATYGPVAAGEESKMGEGNFYGLAADDAGVYVTSNGDDTKGWILKLPLPVKAGKNQKLKAFIATKEFTETINAPVGITMTKKGNLMVGQMGAVNLPKDSWLVAFSPKTGKGLNKAATGLHDIAGLGYSPKSGKLYCVDFAWLAPKEGGLFRLDYKKGDGGTMDVKTTKIAALDRPTSMAFAADGTLYITVNGASSLGSKEKTGKVVQIKGAL